MYDVTDGVLVAQCDGKPCANRHFNGGFPGQRSTLFTEGLATENQVAVGSWRAFPMGPLGVAGFCWCSAKCLDSNPPVEAERVVFPPKRLELS